jgi:stage III sporulation protein AB
MNYRIIGAILIIASSSAMGFSMAAAQKREEAALLRLLRALEFMACELECRLTPLPDLCDMTARQVTGPVREVFTSLSLSLQRHTEPDAASCMEEAVISAGKLPVLAARNLRLLGKGLGRFDLDGQLSSIRSVSQLCSRDLRGLQSNQQQRLRSYRTLGICAGIALVIIFI